MKTIRTALLTLGHFAIDLISSSKIAVPQPTLGGPPTYVSLAARKLGTRVSVVSKVGGDFPRQYVAWLSAMGVDLSGLKIVEDASTTSFVLRYEGEGRRLRLRRRAPPIYSEDVPRPLRAKAVHVSPIANEVAPEAIDELRKSADVLSLDPQGFVRRFDGKGNVSLGGWMDLRVLGQIDVYKSSEDEIGVVTGSADLRSAMKRIQDLGARVVVTTRGVRGSAMLLEGSFYEIPACKSRVLRDPTGAGDAFIGAFLAEYIQGKDPEWCARVGSAAASFVVEGIGPTVFGGRVEVYARAASVTALQGKP